MVLPQVSSLVPPFPEPDERIEAERMLRVPGMIEAVASAGSLPDDLAQAFVGVAHVDQEDVLPGVIAVPQERVHEEGLPGAGRSQQEGVVVVDMAAVPCETLDVDVDGNVAKPVTYAEEPAFHGPLERLVETQAEHAPEFVAHEIVQTDLAGGSWNPGKEE